MNSTRGPAEYPPFDDEPTTPAAASVAAWLTQGIRIRLKVYIHDGTPYVAVGIGAQQGSVMVCLMHDEKESKMIMLDGAEWNQLPQFYFTSGQKLAAKTEFKHKPEDED